MKKNILIKSFLMMLLILASTAYIGCDKKTAETEEPKDKDSIAIIESEQPDIKPDPDTDPGNTIPDITGKWTGMFDQRSTVLEINEQTGSTFSGKISISYREAIHQQVKGTFTQTTREMTMTDQLHSRFQGRYHGKLSEDYKNFSGTFTMSADNSKFSFNLNKK